MSRAGISTESNEEEQYMIAAVYARKSSERVGEGAPMPGVGAG